MRHRLFLWAVIGLFASGSFSVAEEKALPGRAARAKDWKSRVQDWLVKTKPSRIRDDPFGYEDDLRDISQQITEIRDPAALPALAGLIGHKDHNVRFALLETLHQMPSRETLRLLVRIACEDENIVIRQTAADLILTDYKAREIQETIPVFTAYLRGGKYRATAITALEDTSLLKPLGEQDRPNRQLTMSLITALVEEERVVLPAEGRASGVWFGNTIGTWWDWQVHRPQGTFVTRDERFEVREALRRYTGQDFGYDQAAWKKWYLSRSRIAPNQKPRQ